MTVLALRLSRYANGVSALHGTVSRRMWQPLFVNTAEENVPIGHITNGIHVQIVGRASDASPVRPKSGERLAQAPADARDLGGHQPGRRRRAVGDAAGAQGPVDQFRAEPAGFAGPAAERAGCGDRAGDGGARRACAHDRFCAAVRHLQAIGAGSAGRRAAGRPGERDGSADPDHFRRQGASRGPDGEGADPGDRAADAAGASLRRGSCSWKTTT